MRRILLISFFCLFVSCMTGCEKALLKYNLRVVKKHQIELPDRIGVIAKREYYIKTDSFEHNPRMIIYVDSSSCTSCRIDKLVMYNRLYQLSEECGAFQLFVCFSPGRSDKDALTKLLCRYNYPFPIYIDEDNNFLERNSFLPKDERFHNLLTDKHGFPVFVGDPVSDERLFRLFEQHIQSF